MISFAVNKREGGEGGRGERSALRGCLHRDMGEKECVCEREGGCYLIAFAQVGSSEEKGLGGLEMAFLTGDEERGVAILKVGRRERERGRRRVRRSCKFAQRQAHTKGTHTKANTQKQTHKDTNTHYHTHPTHLITYVALRPSVQQGGDDVMVPLLAGHVKRRGARLLSKREKASERERDRMRTMIIRQVEG